LDQLLNGKRLAVIRKLIANGGIVLITTERLLTEIQEVTRREKLKKYFPEQSVVELVELLQTIAMDVAIEPIHTLCRDSKDDFLLDLIDFSKADFLVTGDQDLIALTPFKTAQILSPKAFEEHLKRRK
jgi:putative PIN family toxin of toxin-antitoxin system